MTTNGTPTGGPTSKDELNEAFGALVCSAHQNGVDVTGGYDVRNRDDVPNWGIEVYVVEKSDDATDTDATDADSA